jgi:hypothetical protein
MKRTARHHALPPTLAPRGLDRAAAAAYIGVGVTKFNEMVADGRMPAPKCIDSKKIWSRPELDKFFEALPDDDSSSAPGDVWGELSA